MVSLCDSFLQLARTVILRSISPEATKIGRNSEKDIKQSQKSEDKLSREDRVTLSGRQRKGRAEVETREGMYQVIDLIPVNELEEDTVV